MTTEEMDVVMDHFWDLLEGQSEDDLKPQFDGSKYKAAYTSFICIDQETVVALEEKIPKIKWDGPPLKVMKQEDMPDLMRAVTYIPNRANSRSN